MFTDSDTLDENVVRDHFFNLNEFFKTTDGGSFVHNNDVDAFLDTITTNEKYPLGSEESREQIKHSLWLLDRVDSAKALARKLRSHPLFACDMEALENKFKTETVAEKVKEFENKKQEKDNKAAENEFMYPKLKAFARSISSFLMAYGDENTTCDRFNKIIPPNTFMEMTGIAIEDYDYFLKKEYFNTVVFNDSIKEFLRLKQELANYFDEDQEGDIFDYIPPQKTNQIFTPKKVVKEMCDLLEENEPGCFDNPEKTFIDLYMKSGLYVAEIVKRLFRSEKLKAVYPDEQERLKHIFKHQVYGLAPTEIIYNIACNFVLGFDPNLRLNDDEHNLRQLDATPYARAGTLEKRLDKLYLGVSDETPILSARVNTKLRVTPSAFDPAKPVCHIPSGLSASGNIFRVNLTVDKGSYSNPAKFVMYALTPEDRLCSKIAEFEVGKDAESAECRIALQNAPTGEVKLILAYKETPYSALDTVTAKNNARFAALI